MSRVCQYDQVRRQPNVIPLIFHEDDEGYCEGEDRFDNMLRQLLSIRAQLNDCVYASVSNFQELI